MRCSSAAMSEEVLAARAWMLSLTVLNSEAFSDWCFWKASAISWRTSARLASMVASRRLLISAMSVVSTGRET